MSLLNQDLQKSLLKGYISDKNESNLELLPEFLINDSSQNQKVLTTIIRELQNCEEFWFSVAFITTSGVAVLMNTLLELKERNIKGKILVSKYLNFTQPLALERLLNNFPKNIELRIAEFGDFHAKSYLFRKGKSYNLIVGSSNMTSAALCKNKEWNLKITALKNSYLMRNALKEFQSEFLKATPITKEWLLTYALNYEKVKFHNKNARDVREQTQVTQPNIMQQEALINLKKLRNKNCSKALLISATGTGKTYLSAFDVAAVNPLRCLFIVHRRNIAEAAMNTFKKVIGKDKSFGLYSGYHRESEADFLFTTIQTISRTIHMNQFKPNHFDYIIIDETHRAGASSYTKVIEYFKPQFLLGMTATPERTDGLDVFSLFDHNIAYEIRLHRALEENMLSEFHYYGVQDLTVNGLTIEEKSEFRYLEAKERIDHILNTSKSYGTDDGIIRGLVFCSRKEECHSLSSTFNQRGYNTIALTGDSSEEIRKEAIIKLESDSKNKLDYIFTVDIFNEGIDIPKVNQILMLRPTNSAIIFVQQLGRGLRKVKGKKYVTIIDFIGNYQNNYLVPIALYGDTSYNKDTLRKMMSGGSKMLPGASTINFDKVTKESIYASIDSTNMQVKKDLTKDYDLLKYKLGHQPMMMDFIRHGSRDPFQYISYSKSSFYDFAAKKEKELNHLILGDDLLLLKYFSKEINNSKRVEESLLLYHLILDGSTSFKKLNSDLESRFSYKTNIETYESAIHNIELKFVTENHERKLKKVSTIYGLSLIYRSIENIKPGSNLSQALKNINFKKYLLDNTLYSIHKFSKDFKKENYSNGFVLYRKYSRKDCFRILNWSEQPLAQNVGGYMFHPENKNCPIFLNYHKEEGISDTTKYEDRFIDTHTLEYMSKSNRKLSSPDVIKFKEAKEKTIKLLLFVKKKNIEGDDFYYMGIIKSDPKSFIQTTMVDKKNGKKVNVVKMNFNLERPVERDMYEYITKDNI
jgi:superfamily II DNA or RNA helicase/HKD family nuclease